MRQLFSPVYDGGVVVVRPKHWWSPKARKTARLAAKLIAHQNRDEAMQQAIRAEVTHRLLYGDPL